MRSNSWRTKPGTDPRRGQKPVATMTMRLVHRGIAWLIIKGHERAQGISQKGHVEIGALVRNGKRASTPTCALCALIAKDYPKRNTRDRHRGTTAARCFVTGRELQRGLLALAATSYIASPAGAKPSGR